jgi:hypothetical protein
MKELLEFGVIDACGTKSKDHLRRQRVGVSSYVVDEQVWLLQYANKHGFVLQILIRYV